MTARTIDQIHCIDTNQYGLAKRGAAYVIEAARVCLVETGTPKALPQLKAALEQREPAYVFVTHVHLDHAGAAGGLAAAFPSSTIVAHPRAIRHLADPSRLVEGVRAASPDLFPLYGEPVPIPEDRLYPAADGERFVLGGEMIVEALHTPGHAPHHLCFFERSTRTLFTGDAVGNHRVPVDVPLTVPPRFDPSAALETLDRLSELGAERLAFTHFGLADDPPARLLAGYADEIRAWFERIRALASKRSPEEVVAEILADSRYSGIEQADRFSIEMCVRGALLSIGPDPA